MKENLFKDNSVIMEKQPTPDNLQGPLLEQIESPADLKKLPAESLPRLAQEIREKIIDTVSKTGGHLSPNLGVVELTIALHYVFDSPHDKIIWDVGHQCYTHKLLTGRRDQFQTLRQFKGISGFPSRLESPHDIFDVGHSGTSISTALGLTESQKQKGEHDNIIVVIGDGSINTGLAFEGLNQTGDLESKLIVVLNDNEMSISPNVGALSAYLSRIITGKAYNRVHTELMHFLKTIPSIGPTLFRTVKQAEESFKGLIVPGLLFEELGFTYVGPIQGHNFRQLLENLKNIKNLSRRPLLLHVITKKGKGYLPAEQDPENFHGIGPFDKATGNPHKANNAHKSYTEVFCETLNELAVIDNRIIAITAGMTTGTGLVDFKKLFPQRFYDVGIAEEHAVAFAAGLATGGFRPVVAIYSTFLQRAYDQMLHDVCWPNLPVLFAIDRAGIVGEDGPTHQGLFDLSYLRHLPNLVVMTPKDENEFRHMLYTAMTLAVPVAIRYPRGKVEGVNIEKPIKTLPLGKAEVLCEGSKLAIFALGKTVSPALSAATLLKNRGISATIVNSRFVKPLDQELVCALARKTGKILTVEENVLAGGFGSALLETLEHNNITGVKVKRIGISDQFVEHGSPDILRKKYGLDAAGIFQAACELLE
ncbi:MAG: 1-deoxy-D-xylulose-5-phosphate synthase [Thermodesulfobacteriota bacterium]|jgi:1-deoxy-D-xylulose-5-phosphate synthase|nr:MAG: 1-deoxy-D-xylulose-5-phosphate synthase [Thermodesulfobacteriota bacterium]